MTCSADLQSEVAEEAARLEATFTAEKLGRLVRLRGPARRHLMPIALEPISEFCEGSGCRLRRRLNRSFARLLARGTPMELGMISSTWLDTKVGRLDGIRTAKQIGFDTYDIFEDPLDLTDAEREEIKSTCAEVGLPVRSVVCVAFGIVDFNPSVRRFTLDRIKAYVDQGAFLGARNVLLVVGEYFWDCEVFPQAGDLGPGQGDGQGGRRVRAVEGPRDRARARAVRPGAAQGRPRAGALRAARSTTRQSGRTPTSRTCTCPVRPSTTSRS